MTIGGGKELEEKLVVRRFSKDHLSFSCVSFLIRSINLIVCGTLHWQNWKWILTLNNRACGLVLIVGLPEALAGSTHK